MMFFVRNFLFCFSIIISSNFLLSNSFGTDDKNVRETIQTGALGSVQDISRMFESGGNANSQRSATLATTGISGPGGDTRSSAQTRGILEKIGGWADNVVRTKTKEKGPFQRAGRKVTKRTEEAVERIFGNKKSSDNEQSKGFKPAENIENGFFSRGNSVDDSTVAQETIAPQQNSGSGNSVIIEPTVSVKNLAQVFQGSGNFSSTGEKNTVVSQSNMPQPENDATSSSSNALPISPESDVQKSIRRALDKRREAIAGDWDGEGSSILQQGAKAEVPLEEIKGTVRKLFWGSKASDSSSENLETTPERSKTTSEKPSGTNSTESTRSAFAAARALIAPQLEARLAAPNTQNNPPTAIKTGSVNQPESNGDNFKAMQALIAANLGRQNNSETKESAVNTVSVKSPESNNAFKAAQKLVAASLGRQNNSKTQETVTQNGTDSMPINEQNINNGALPPPPPPPPPPPGYILQPGLGTDTKNLTSSTSSQSDLTGNDDNVEVQQPSKEMEDIASSRRYKRSTDSMSDEDISSAPQTSEESRIFNENAFFDGVKDIGVTIMDITSSMFDQRTDMYPAAAAAAGDNDKYSSNVWHMYKHTKFRVRDYYSSSFNAKAFGYDSLVSDRLMLGITIFANSYEANFQSSYINYDEVYTGVYGKYLLTDKVTFSGNIGYSIGKMKQYSSDNIRLRSHKIDNFTSRLGVSYKLIVGNNIEIIPNISANYLLSSTDIVAFQSQRKVPKSKLRIAGEIKVRKEYKYNDGRIVPYLSIGTFDTTVSKDVSLSASSQGKIKKGLFGTNTQGLIGAGLELSKGMINFGIGAEKSIHSKFKKKKSICATLSIVL